MCDYLCNTFAVCDQEQVFVIRASEAAWCSDEAHHGPEDRAVIPWPAAQQGILRRLYIVTFYHLYNPS